MRRLFSCCYLLSAVGALACGGVSDLPKNQPCKEVGYAISSRTLDCTGNLQLANRRHDQFMAAIACTASTGADTEFECAVSLNGATCDEVLSYGETWDAWLLRTGSCADILRYRDARPVPRPPVVP